MRPHTRPIILAGESTPADVITSMRERAFSYFSQLFSLDTLADMIRNATEGPCWDDGIEIISLGQMREVPNGCTIVAVFRDQ